MGLFSSTLTLNSPRNVDCTKTLHEPGELFDLLVFDNNNFSNNTEMNKYMRTAVYHIWDCVDGNAQLNNGVLNFIKKIAINEHVCTAFFASLTSSIKSCHMPYHQHSFIEFICNAVGDRKIIQSLENSFNINYPYQKYEHN